MQSFDEMAKVVFDNARWYFVCKNCKNCKQVEKQLYTVDLCNITGCSVKENDTCSDFRTK
jgi:hypothetical protein